MVAGHSTRVIEFALQRDLHVNEIARLRRRVERTSNGMNLGLGLLYRKEQFTTGHTSFLLAIPTIISLIT